MLPDYNFVVPTANMKMPFGKYKDSYLSKISEFYIIWYKNKGFSQGKLGKMIALVYAVKPNKRSSIKK
ncbi:putative quorum-sensing-regulated virulence factor [Tenacibaculum sp. SG-28]|uniref:putative quorum-sensing-regulated virulence factor n=1 Tax=Tenacibaculum sp. SG-28 TaxID=754426 RepID=UPI000CF5386F|nr:DUF3820 family protein [Tenacibaculum sp. SG-28]PQJ22908.1 hypothetical protein BSU00_01015 [Tenacibaculum sp. SG-28]